MIGLLKTLVLGRENGLRSKIRRAVLGGGGSTDTSPGSAYSSPTYTPPAAPSLGLEPPRGVTPPEGFEVVLHKDAVSPGEIVEVIAGGTAIAVANVDGEFFAVANACPHADGPLGEGSLDGGVVTCPYHGWAFDIKTGACQTNTSAEVQIYEVALEGNAVCVRL